MDKRIEILLTRRDVACVARLLESEAPRTCAAVWEMLPTGGEAYHGKYARNEVYTFVDPPAPDPGRENPTVTPIPGDVCYFAFDRGDLPPGPYGYREDEGAAGRGRVVDLAVFYGRNNLLVNGDIGFVPANVFATIEENLPAMAEACNDIWRAGAVGEELRFRRL